MDDSENKNQQDNDSESNNEDENTTEDELPHSKSILSETQLNMNDAIMEEDEDEDDDIDLNNNKNNNNNNVNNTPNSVKDKVLDTFTKIKNRINSNNDVLNDNEIKKQQKKINKKGKRQSALAVIKDKTQRLFTPKNKDKNTNNKKNKKMNHKSQSIATVNDLNGSNSKKRKHKIKKTSPKKDVQKIKASYKEKSRSRLERKSLQPMKTKDRELLRARSLTRKDKTGSNTLNVINENNIVTNDNNDKLESSASQSNLKKHKISKKKKLQKIRKSDMSVLKKHYNYEKSKSVYGKIGNSDNLNDKYNKNKKYSKKELSKTQSINDGNNNNNNDVTIYKQKKKVKYRVKNEIFEIFDYYRPIKLIGSGAYAVVCEAVDKRNGKKVAIKKNKHIFDDIRDARRILREIKLLMHFDKHVDIIDLYDTIPPYLNEIELFSDVYIVMPLLESNLCKIITSSQELTNLHYQYLTYQVLRGLKYIHSTGVIHRDIKPENILINGKDCDVKIIDFGLARGVLKDEDNRLKEQNTEYVCTRWYRSPEVMCSGGMYDEKMDIWGVGCLLAEMILRRPLFPGNNYMDQLKIIFEVMGTPTTTEWIKNDQAKKWVKKQKPHKGKNFKKMFKSKFDNDNDLENCLDLLDKLLKLSPKERISAADSLEHPYFKDMHDPPLATEGKKFDLSFEFEKSIKTKFGVRHMMYESLNEFHVLKKKKKKERKLRKLKEKQKKQKKSEKQVKNQ